MPGVAGSSPASSTITTASEEPAIAIRPWKLVRRTLAFASRPWVEVYDDTVALQARSRRHLPQRARG